MHGASPAIAIDVGGVEQYIPGCCCCCCCRWKKDPEAEAMVAAAAAAAENGNITSEDLTD
jgi:hypothetical protein